MKTILSSGFILKRIRYTLLIVFSLFTLSSCYKGYDGRPGDAYLSLAWEVSKPYYVDAGPEIPPTFRWSEFYYATPGVYYLYYEGQVWNGWRWITYAWEVQYEIWRIPGEPGGYGYHGYDGTDTYLTLVCSPYGPYEDRFENRSAIENEDSIEISEKEIVVEKIQNDVGIRVKYSKVEPRNSFQK
ncbi:MAG: hypothetical protein ABIJ97_03575 [Bacteroidota bacterium]